VAYVSTDVEDPRTSPSYSYLRPYYHLFYSLPLLREKGMP
jgi:hypothetical protein